MKCINLFLLIALSGFQALSQDVKYAAPKNLGDPATLGLGIQRTMTLLSTSTPEHRNTVRILFYGQSITEQSWWKIVADDLRKRFPNANLVIENRALGGYSSQRLVLAAETDLYSFYPDLMIFYVYGSHIEYENIIRRTRERTTAEILIQTDHTTADDNLTEETDPAKLSPNGKIWNSFMNYKFLPETAKKYGCGVVDQRNLWKEYLKANKLAATNLLRDGVHLNDHGCYLMGEFVKASLVQRQDAAIDPMNCEQVKTVAVGEAVKWVDGKLTLPFEGNRVDLIYGEREGGAASVRIDGKKPSEFPELYGFTRAMVLNSAGAQRGKWPAVMAMKWDSLPQLEDWTMEVSKESEKVLNFSLTGSKTGLDGKGSSDKKFVSNSKRVIIDPEDWHVDYALSLAGVKPVPDNFRVRWQVVPHFVDEAKAPAKKQKGVESVLTVAQGLKNGKHLLELTGETPVVAVRIYKPGLSENSASGH